MAATRSNSAPRSNKNCLFLVFALYASILVLFVLPTGAFPWSMTITACLLSVAVLISSTHNGMPIMTPTNHVHLLAGLGIVFIALYLIPLPLSLTAITPERYTQNAAALSALDDAAETDLIPRGISGWFCTTRNKAGTVRILLSAITAVGGFLAASGFSTAGKRRLLSFLWFCIVILAVAGCMGQWCIPQGDTLWWKIPVPRSLPGPVACFRSRNHYGALLALASPVGFAMFLNSIGERRFLRAAGCLATYLLVCIAVFLSLSRGAMITLLFGTIISLVLFLSANRKRGAAVAILALGLLFFGIAAKPQNAVRERVESLSSINETDSYKTRVSAWMASISIWRTYPVLGSGPNGFRMTYPQHRTTSESSFLTHPENEYVQLLSDTGLVGVLISGLLLISLLRKLVFPAVFNRQSSPLELAGVAALCIAAFNSLLDFPLHSPIYLLVLAALLGTLPESNRATPENGTGTSNGTLTVTPGTVPGICLFLSLAVGIPCSRNMRLDSPSHIRKYGVHRLAKAVQWAPTSWYAWYLLGYHSAKTKDAEGLEFAEHCMLQAANYDPNNYKLWLRLGKVQMKKGDLSEARRSFARVKDLKSWVEVPRLPGGEK